MVRPPHPNTKNTQSPLALGCNFVLLGVTFWRLFTKDYLLYLLARSTPSFRLYARSFLLDFAPSQHLPEKAEDDACHQSWQP